MKTLLLLQNKVASDDAGDEMRDLTVRLMKTLGKTCEVDGYEEGEGTFNIFIYSEDPIAAFAELREAIPSRVFWTCARAAYRRPEADEFTVLWPIGDTHFEMYPDQGGGDAGEGE